MYNRVAWGILFLFAYVLTSVFAAGAGHGTYFFFAPLMPYGCGAILLLACFYLIKYLKSGWIKLLFVAFLITDYLVTLMFVISWWRDDYPYLVKTWSISPIHVVLPSMVYLFGNGFLWYMFGTSFVIPEISEFDKSGS